MLFERSSKTGREEMCNFSSLRQAQGPLEKGNLFSFERLRNYFN